jgi:hypothetical protein
MTSIQYIHSILLTSSSRALNLRGIQKLRKLLLSKGHINKFIFYKNSGLAVVIGIHIAHSACQFNLNLRHTAWNTGLCKD